VRAKEATQNNDNVGKITKKINIKKRNRQIKFLVKSFSFCRTRIEEKETPIALLVILKESFTNRLLYFT